MTKLIPGLLAVCGAALLWAWIERQPTDLKEAANLDRQAGAQSSGSQPAGVRARLTRGDGVACDLPGAWPQFRGPARDGVSPETAPLARQWPAEGPKVLWSVELGEGHAGPVVLGGRVFIFDYDRQSKSDALRCLSLADGKEIWRYSYPVDVKRNHGMSRTVPAVTEQFLVALGPKCHVICLNPATGECLWSMDLVREYGAKVPPWYAGQCPLIDEGRAILAPAAPDVLLMAVDCATGKVLWKTPNPCGWQMTHSSVMPMEFAARRMYVYCGSGGVAGVSAENGSVLWDTTEWQIPIATVPSPVIVGDGRIFLSGGYEAGCMMLQIKESDGRLSAEKVFRLKPDVFGATQHTPILFDGDLYGVRPDGQLVCLATDGKALWKSGSGHRFGLGPFLIADGRLFLMDDSGVLTMAEAGASGYRQLAQARVLTGHDSWGPMALAGDRLLARDLTTMVCLDVAAR